VEHEGNLWLAKFPERTDRFNLQSIEFATLDLARRCGLSTCQAQLQKVSGRDVLMLKRFDRQPTNGGYFRLGFVSALTVLDAEDNYLSRDRWSYPLLAENLRRWSSRPQHDCAELFRRMVFNAAVTNNDDHPRNHALLRHPDGWRLSPVYDVVPVPVVSLERRRSRDALYLGLSRGPLCGEPSVFWVIWGERHLEQSTLPGGRGVSRWRVQKCAI
jgi:serine/threonine-protein kinase HipA